jgi:hypothetical protein
MSLTENQHGRASKNGIMREAFLSDTRPCKFQKDDDSACTQPIHQLSAATSESSTSNGGISPRKGTDAAGSLEKVTML